MIQVVWRPAVGFEGFYEVNNFGQMKSLPKNGKPEVILKKQYDLNGYVYYRPKLVHVFAHRAVLRAFVGEPTPPRTLCNHKNGIRDDNRPDNLEWCTNQENLDHAKNVLKSAVWLSGASHPCAKLNKLRVDAIRHMRCERIGIREIARLFGLNPQYVDQICQYMHWNV